MDAYRDRHITFEERLSRGKTRVFVRVDLGYLPDGKRHQPGKTHDTHHEAQAWAVATIDAWSDFGAVTKPAEVTLADALEAWMVARVASGLAPSTLYR